MPDPLSLIFGLGPVSLDLNALARWFKEAPVRTVAYRFLKVFNDHGVKNTQIQRLVPEVTLDKVTDPAALVPALTSDVLDKTARLFGIERAWLDGVDARMYPVRLARRRPQVFFDELAAVARPDIQPPLRAYCVDAALDRDGRKPAGVVLTLVDRIADWDAGDELVRYRPLTELWRWNAPGERLALKAILLAALERGDIDIVPVHLVSPGVLNDLATGRAVPPSGGLSQALALEDFLLTPERSRVAKETDELADVRAAMVSMGIGALPARIEKPTKSASRSTTVVGYVNRNGQRNLGRREPPEAGNDHVQFVYDLECRQCQHRYGANGSDIWQRKCPRCQGGAQGL